MAKKDKKVDTLTHSSGASVDIFINPNANDEDGLKFNATVGDARFVEADASTLKRRVLQYMDALIQLEWFPVLRVEETVVPFAKSAAQIGIHLSRMFLAQRRDGKILQLGWEEYHHATNAANRIQLASQLHVGIQNLPNDLPFVRKVNNGYTNTLHILPYDENSYQGLHLLEKGLRFMQTRLSELLSTEMGRSQLATFGSQVQQILPKPPTDA